MQIYSSNFWIHRKWPLNDLKRIFNLLIWCIEVRVTVIFTKRIEEKIITHHLVAVPVRMPLQLAPANYTLGHEPLLRLRSMPLPQCSVRLLTNVLN